jgi:hypothetical protein
MIEKSKSQILKILEEDLKTHTIKELLLSIRALEDKDWFYIEFPNVDDEMRHQMWAYVKVELIDRGVL